MSPPPSTKPPGGGGQASILSFLHRKSPPATPVSSSTTAAASSIIPPPPPPPPPVPSSAFVHPPSKTTTSQPSAIHRPQTPPPALPSSSSTLALAQTTNLSPSSRSPHPSATIRPVTAVDLPALKRINSLLLPVPYPESFYHNAILPDFSGPFSRVISWRDPPTTASSTTTTSTSPEAKIVGGIVCKIVTSSWVTSGGLVNDPAGPNVLYIQSLTVLAPYRSYGLAAAALDSSVRTALSEHAHRNVTAVCAHVWTENSEGMRWYEARGFEKLGTRPLEYYHRLRPGTAWVVRRRIVPAFDRSASPIAKPLPTAHPQRDEDADGFVAVGAPPPPPPAVAAALNSGGTDNGNDSSNNNNNDRPLPPRGQSYQNQRPVVEWNDLPEDMMSAVSVPKGLAPPSGPASATPSGASSRSSSTAPGAGGRKKKERGYPAAAFGS